MYAWLLATLDILISSSVPWNALPRADLSPMMVGNAGHVMLVVLLTGANVSTYSLAVVPSYVPTT